MSIYDSLKSENLVHIIEIDYSYPKHYRDRLFLSTYFTRSSPTVGRSTVARKGCLFGRQGTGQKGSHGHILGYVGRKGVSKKINGVIFG